MEANHNRLLYIVYLPHLTHPQLTNRNWSPSSNPFAHQDRLPLLLVPPFHFSFVFFFFRLFPCLRRRCGTDRISHQLLFIPSTSATSRCGMVSEQQVWDSLTTAEEWSLNILLPVAIDSYEAHQSRYYALGYGNALSFARQLFVIPSLFQQGHLRQDATNVLIEYYAATDASACLQCTKTTLHFPPISKSDVLDNLAYIDSGNTCYGSKRMAHLIIRPSVYCKAIVVGYNDDSAKPYKGRITNYSPSDTRHSLRVWAQFILSVLWIAELILLHHSSACWYIRMLWSWPPQARYYLGWTWALKWVQRSQCRSHSRVMDTNACEMRIL